MSRAESRWEGEVGAEDEGSVGGVGIGEGGGGGDVDWEGWVGKGAIGEWVLLG